MAKKIDVEVTIASGKSLCRSCPGPIKHNGGNNKKIPKGDKAILITSPCAADVYNGIKIYLCEKHAREFLAKMIEVMDGAM